MAGSGADHSPGRVTFARLPEVLPVPELLRIQLESFRWFQNEGLRELLEEISPIEDFTGQRLSLDLFVPAWDPFGEPAYGEDECRARGLTYAVPLTVRARLTNKVMGEIIEKDLFLGMFPRMTATGGFIINGSERVIVNQLVRSPGVYFTAGEGAATGQEGYVAKLIPGRGAWVEFEVNAKNLLIAKIDHKRKVHATTFLRAVADLAGPRWPGAPVDLATDRGMLEAFGGADTGQVRYIEETLKQDPTGDDVEGALLALYRKLRPWEPARLDNARAYLRHLLFDPRRYDLGKVGRYKFNKRLALAVPPEIRTLTRDDLVVSICRLLDLHNGRGCKDDIDHLGNRRLRCVGEQLQNKLRVGLFHMERIVKERMSIQDLKAVSPTTLIALQPIAGAVREFFGGSQLAQLMDQTNALSEVAHKRRISALGPGGLTRERAGFEVRDVHPSHYGRLCPIETPEGPNIGLVSNLATYARVNPYGFIVTPYRRVCRRLLAGDPRLIGRELRGSALPGEGALTAPDGQELLAAGQHARVDQVLFDRLALLPADTEVLVTPFVSEAIDYLAADDEEVFWIAQANARLTEAQEFCEPRLLTRHHGEFVIESSEKVDYLEVSPRQVVSISTSLIPFLAHDDVNRALMGANMQRQAVPLLQPQSPICGTGMELRVALDSGQVLTSPVSGLVTSATGRRIEIAEGQGERHVFPLRKFLRSNAGTCINQRPVVYKGDLVSAGQVIADSASTQNGELALGQSVLVAFMSWEGGNYEDAILLSERVVREDVFTSIHFDKFQVAARMTRQGAEEITRDVPNVAEERLRHLDERGIVRVGAVVDSHDILVGKVTPRAETELSAEEKLLRAVFGQRARDVRDTSLRLPHGFHGTVVSVGVYSRGEGDDLEPGVQTLVRIVIGQKCKIGPGDKMAGRHGNKGVVSRVLPAEDMPFLPDGTPVDIILNPLGVPHRMNIGQIMETHLGWAAHLLGVKIATPVFDGASREDIETYLRRAGLSVLGKVQLYDGRTGEPFRHLTTVGYKYMLKLAHLVDKKVHARSTGPYSMITQQPLGGKAHFGGQRLGEMEVWALEAYGAATILQEMLTVKSDDVLGRLRTYEAIVKGEQLVEPGVPESLKVLVKELQSLCMDIEVRNDEEHQLEFVEAELVAGMPYMEINVAGREKDEES